MNINYFTKYKLNKNGLLLDKKKKCVCGETLSEDVITCPVCGNKLTKSLLLNVGKKSPLAKRYETEDNDTFCCFHYFQLLSHGFDLNEIEFFTFYVDKVNEEIKISNSKVFKSIVKKKDFIDFLNNSLPGFYKFINRIVKNLEYDYATPSFSSVNEGDFKNFLHIYLNYSTLIPYFCKYKLAYYGRYFDLSTYYPSVNFNNLDELEECSFNQNLLRTLDLKNPKYIKTLVDISDNVPKETQEILEEIMNDILDSDIDIFSYSYQDNQKSLIDCFSLLYNNEVSLNDFIRIFNESEKHSFYQLAELKRVYKRVLKESIDWSNVKIETKFIKILQTQERLMKDDKLTRTHIRELSAYLDDSPLKALDYLINLK